MLAEFFNNWIAWLMLLLPLFSAAVNFIWLRKENFMAQAVSISCSALALLIAFGIWLGAIHVPTAPLIKWIDVSTLQIEIGWLDNALSRAMLLVVTGVGFLVHVFSVGYMDHDKDRARFFGLLSLFMFSMLGIVIANNLVMMYIFWELVGLSSYLLVGFWWFKESASAAAKKAFLCNRVGDFGFLLGILFYWSTTGTLTLDFDSTAGVAALAALSALPTWELTLMGLLLFCGCVGKSAMFPLHVWLPDAMEGPTPVSALIHAATMVAAGVYMLCRVFPILEMSPDALMVIAWVGAGVCLGAAFVGCQQDDIKRILAYSTLSQLGYMVMAVGISAPGAAMFHLSTHACFKAGLFLCSGAIIHQCHEEQDTWRMGGLWKKMPITIGCFFMCALALSGCPYTAGYFSKDLIIELAGGSSVPGAVGLYWIGFGAAILTAFYMFRLMTIAFLGKPRTEQAEHAKEYGWVMIFPVATLALFALGAGWPIWGWETYYGLATYGGLEQFTNHFKPEWLSKVVGWSFFAIGTASAILLYRGKNKEPYRFGPMVVLNHKFYFDELYDNVLLKIQQGFARLLAWFDDWIIGGLIVRGSAALAEFSGQMLRLFQTGNLQAYAFLFGLGVIILFYFVLFRLPIGG